MMLRSWRFSFASATAKGDVDVPADQIPLIDQIYKSGKPVITAALGSPYLIERFPQAETWIVCLWHQRCCADFHCPRALRRKSPSRDTCR